MQQRKPLIIAHFGATHDSITLNLPEGQQIIQLNQFNQRSKPEAAKRQRHAAIELVVEFWARKHNLHYAKGGAL